MNSIEIKIYCSISLVGQTDFESLPSLRTGSTLVLLHDIIVV